ncbi:hypothetical protein CBS101457_000932 [Exobasidium rhododendri]|nr:hypothetical protein CBS101457_000932 [Exobasidium rhododendri]
MSGASRRMTVALSRTYDTTLPRKQQLLGFSRWQSTSSPSSSSSSSSSSAPATTESPLLPPHRRSTGPPSKHKLFYRTILPPLFRVLAYGSAVYFALHLTWQYLDGNEQRELENQVRDDLESKVKEQLQKGGVVEQEKSVQSSKSSKSWFGWLS